MTEKPETNGRIKKLLTKAKMPLLIGFASGLLYSSIVVLDCLELNTAFDVTVKAALTQFLASFSKTAISYSIIVSGQNRAQSLFRKIIATYWQIPLTILVYAGFHIVAGTPELVSKLVKITVVMCIYYTVLLAHHLRSERKSTKA